MRVCPKCGYKDPPYWRGKHWRILTDYCRLEDLEYWNPKLAKIVREKRDVKISGYIYHLTKSNIVDRIHESDSADGITYREPDTEGRPRFIPPSQTKLLEVTKQKEINQ